MLEKKLYDALPRTNIKVKSKNLDAIEPVYRAIMKIRQESLNKVDLIVTFGNKIYTNSSWVDLKSYSLIHINEPIFLSYNEPNFCDIQKICFN